jgi:L-fuconolactonase
MIRTLDSANVAGALIVTPAIYGWDNSYSIEAYQSAPSRFRVIGRIDPLRADVHVAVGEWRSQPGMVGLRVIAATDQEQDMLRSGALTPLFRAAANAEVPVCITAPGAFDAVEDVARRYGRLQLVIDNLGFPPPWIDEDDRFAHIPALLRLVPCENVSVKLCAAPSASRHPYPYPDLWPPLHRLISGFGPNRFMWGSDTTMHPQPYRESVGWLRDTNELSEADKRAILGANLRRIFRWTDAS